MNLGLANPLFRLHGFLDQDLYHRCSIIHGDLHSRNVIVSPRGTPYYIDFSETGIGPTLFDFIKHEVALWDWNLADPPPRTPRCPLADAVSLMQELTGPGKQFPAPFKVPAFLETRGDRHGWLGKFYQCIVTLRSLAKQHIALPDEEPAVDYFTPLCMYAALVLRWCDPREVESSQEQALRARRGVFATMLSGMLLPRATGGGLRPR